jgi:hypothetical protein
MGGDWSGFGGKRICSSGTTGREGDYDEFGKEAVDDS